MVELAVRSGHLRPDAVHEDGTPLVHIAAKYGAVDLLRAIVLEYGVDADMLCKNRTGDTALGAACFYGQEAAALFLINEAPGCDLNARGGPRRQTPLMLAAMRGLLGVVKALVGKGARVDAVDRDYHTALSSAISSREEEIALYLLEEAGASWRVAVESEEGRRITLLDFAVQHDCTRFLKAFLRRMRAEGVEEEPVRACIREAAR